MEPIFVVHFGGGYRFEKRADQRAGIRSNPGDRAEGTSSPVRHAQDQRIRNCLVCVVPCGCARRPTSLGPGKPGRQPGDKRRIQLSSHEGPDDDPNAAGHYYAYAVQWLPAFTTAIALARRPERFGRFQQHLYKPAGERRDPNHQRNGGVQGDAGEHLFSAEFPEDIFKLAPHCPALARLFGRSPTDGSGRMPLPPGNAQQGFAKFDSSNCRLCHDFNQGRNINGNELLFSGREGTQGAFKSPQLRSVMEKLGMDGMSTNSRAGFGFMHDGRVDTLTSFLTHGFPDVAPTDQTLADLTAFLLCFSGSDLTTNPSGPSQDVPAATGKQITLNSPALNPALNDMFNLAMRTNSRLELVIRGKKSGLLESWLLRRSTQNFQPNRHSEAPASLPDIIASAAPGNEFTALLVPQGSGSRLALDRDGDGYFDVSELELGFNAGDPASHPGRIVSVAKAGGDIVMSWQSAPGVSYTVEWATNLAASAVVGAWKPFSPFVSTQSVTTYTDSQAAGLPGRFYRVRMNP